MKKLYVILYIAYSSISFINAQQDKFDSSSTILDDIIFSANKAAQKKSEIPQQIKILSSKEIQLINSQTTADLLINSGEVFVQKSQQGGGSPSIRGFEASRVLLVIDGVRMNNAIYRAGHLQDIITIDQNLIDRIEVLFGPASTLYGSDALGGVLHFYTRKAKFKSEFQPSIEANAFTRYSSANHESSNHLDFNLSGKKLASVSSFTFSQFGDLRSGRNINPSFDTIFARKEYVQRTNNRDSIFKNDNPLIQTNSGYKQWDLFQKLSYTQNKYITHSLNIQYSNSSNLPRYDRLTEYTSGRLRFAEWYYGPQKRLLTAYQLQVFSTNISDDLKISLAYQDIDQSRINRRLNNNIRTTQSENVKVISLNLDAIKNIRKNQVLGYGIEFVSNDVNSVAHTLNLITNLTDAAATRYPDGGSKMNSLATYISHQWNINKKVRTTSGLRFQGNQIHTKFIDQQFFPFPFTEIKQTNQAITGSLGVTYNPLKSTKISGIASSGFRSPNVDDLTKIFESNKGILIISNPNIKPEYSYNIEIGVEQNFSKYHSLEIHVWSSIMKNAMVLRNFKYNGQDSIDFNGVPSQIQAMQNVNEGFIKGISVTYNLGILKGLNFSSSVTYTYGRYKDIEKDTLIPLDHISPIFGRISVNYKNNKFDHNIYSLYNGWKRLKDYSPSGEDNLQYATPQGMPSWFTINYKCSYNINKYMTIQAGIENILDTHYRYFASGISAPGRNFILSLRAKLI